VKRTDFLTLPANLPQPTDDGACDHLPGAALPELVLAATDGTTVPLRERTAGPTVLFFYPRTGRPDESAPIGWNEIAGARGCTPQSCGFRDTYVEFQARGVAIYGVSTQSTEYQQEFATRMHVPYALLSDEHFALTHALRLPTFEFASMRLLKRMAWYCEGSRIVQVFYPVFPPDQNAAEVLRWLVARE